MADTLTEIPKCCGTCKHWLGLTSMPETSSPCKVLMKQADTNTENAFTRAYNGENCEFWEPKDYLVNTQTLIEEVKAYQAECESANQTVELLARILVALKDYLKMLTKGG